MWNQGTVRCLQCAYSLGQHLDDVGRQSTKPGYPARTVIESFLVKERWRCTFDPTFESGKRRKARGAPLFNDEDLDDINPLTDSVAFDTLLQYESLSEDVREIMRVKYE